MKRPTVRQMEAALQVLLWLHEEAEGGVDRDEISRVRDMLWDARDALAEAPK
jgi:hypothetical protein